MSPIFQYLAAVTVLVCCVNAQDEQVLTHVVVPEPVNIVKPFSLVMTNADGQHMEILIDPSQLAVVNRETDPDDLDIDDLDDTLEIDKNYGPIDSVSFGDEDAEPLVVVPRSIGEIIDNYGPIKENNFGGVSGGRPSIGVIDRNFGHIKENNYNYGPYEYYDTELVTPRVIGQIGLNTGDLTSNHFGTQTGQPSIGQIGVDVGTRTENNIEEVAPAATPTVAKTAAQTAAQTAAPTAVNEKPLSMSELLSLLGPKKDFEDLEDSDDSTLKQAEDSYDDPRERIIGQIGVNNGKIKENNYGGAGTAPSIGQIGVNNGKIKENNYGGPSFPPGPPVPEPGPGPEVPEGPGPEVPPTDGGDGQPLPEGPAQPQVLPEPAGPPPLPDRPRFGERERFERERARIERERERRRRDRLRWERDHRRGRPF